MTETEKKTIHTESGDSLSDKKINNVSLDAMAKKPPFDDIEKMEESSSVEIFSAHDPLLGRHVAIHALKPCFRTDQEALNHFLKEARDTAQLEHPNIMPVHAMGVHEKFGAYFSTKKMEGETLDYILEQLDANNLKYIKRYTQMVRLEIFLSICNGVAFAHSKGVIHRNLKPAHIMIGKFGEVLILNWNHIKTITEEDNDLNEEKRPLQQNLTEQTSADSISGTPYYMSPEQAEGDINAIDFQSDVYGLGALLYSMLTYVAPYEKMGVKTLLKHVTEGRFKSPQERRPELNIPPELNAIVLKAMARAKIQRYAAAIWLAKDIQNYQGNLEVSAYKTPKLVKYWKSCKRHPIKASLISGLLMALIVSIYSSQLVLYARYRSRVDEAYAQQLKGDQTVESFEKAYKLRQSLPINPLKTPTPAEQDLNQKIATLYDQAKSDYLFALSLYSGVPELYQTNRKVIRGYHDIMFSRINMELFQKDFQTVNRLVEQTESLLGPYLDQRAEFELDAVREYLEGKGSLTINGPESIRKAELYRLYDDEGEIVISDPLMKSALPREFGEVDTSAYVIVAVVEGIGRINYSLFLDHSENLEIYLDVPESIPEGMIFIPEGEFFMGGPQARFFREHKTNIDSFFMKRDEVTFAEYIVFWQNLPNETLQKQYMSRIQFNPNERKFIDAWNTAGEMNDERLELNGPVIGITHQAAEAFCQWKSEQLGAIIRLPTVQEWEKAARGEDGRTYVWGNGYNPSHNLTLTLDNKNGKEKYPYFAPPGSFPMDISVYGVRDMAGNVREFTSSRFPDSEERYEIKGGSAFTPVNFLPCCYSSDALTVPNDIGFRYVQEVQ